MEKAMILKVLGGVVVVAVPSAYVINKRFRRREVVVKEGDVVVGVKEESEEVGENSQCSYEIDNMAKEVKQILISNYFDGGFDHPKDPSKPISEADINALKEKANKLKN